MEFISRMTAKLRLSKVLLRTYNQNDKLLFRVLEETSLKLLNAKTHLLFCETSQYIYIYIYIYIYFIAELFNNVFPPCCVIMQSYISINWQNFILETCFNETQMGSQCQDFKQVSFHCQKKDFQTFVTRIQDVK